MVSLAIFITFLFLLVLLVAGVRGVLLVAKRVEFVEAELRRMNLSAIEDSQRFEKLLDDLTARQEAAERRVDAAAQYPPQSINYTQRSQMLRMARRGDSADQISSTLGVPLSQVRLLMKLPGISREAVRAKGKAAGQ